MTREEVIKCVNTQCAGKDHDDLSMLLPRRMVEIHAAGFTYCALLELQSNYELRNNYAQCVYRGSTIGTSHVEGLACTPGAEQMPLCCADLFYDGRHGNHPPSRRRWVKKETPPSLCFPGPNPEQLRRYGSSSRTAKNRLNRRLCKHSLLRGRIFEILARPSLMAQGCFNIIWPVDHISRTSTRSRMRGWLTQVRT